jgi:branched-chain amino acid transport system permease protein/neutral amino acid transport system permease protein
VNQAGFSILVALPVAAASTGILSLLLNRFVFAPFARRGTGLFGLIIVTVSVGFVITHGLQAVFGLQFMSYTGVEPGSSVHVLGMVFTELQLIISGIAVAAMLTMHVLLQYTRLGMAMRATATNPSLARNAGVPTARVVDTTFLLSGSLCGACGVMLVLGIQSFDFEIGSNFLYLIVASAVLGGIGQPYGAMLGALTLGLAGSIVASFTSSGYNEITAFTILILVLLLRPQGIVAEIATTKGVVA